MNILTEPKNGLPLEEEEIIQLAQEYVFDVLQEVENVEVLSLEVSGSRKTGKHREDSDLDIKIRYQGSMKDDHLFNILNDEEEPLYIEGIPIDFFTEKVEKEKSNKELIQEYEVISSFNTLS